MNYTKLSQNLSKFRIVTFDITDTLLKFKTAPAHQYAKTAENFGYPNVDKNLLAANFLSVFKLMQEEYPNFGNNQKNRLHWRDWWRELVFSIFNKTVNIPLDDLKLIEDSLIDHYRTSEAWVKVDGADEIVNKVKSDGKIVGIISNFDPSLHVVIDQMNLPKFDFVITSYEHGISKPHPDIFRKALDLHGVTSKEALHVGNTLKKDYLGAINAGWCGIHISNDLEDWKNIKGINKNHVFPSIRSFLDKLENDKIIW